MATEEILEDGEYFEQVDPVDQVGSWDYVDESDSLYKWVRDGDADRFSMAVEETGDGYRVDYQDSEEIATAIAFFYNFEKEQAAFHYAQDLMYQFEAEDTFLTNQDEIRGENL